MTRGETKVRWCEGTFFLEHLFCYPIPQLVRFLIYITVRKPIFTSLLSLIEKQLEIEV